MTEENKETKQPTMAQMQVYGHYCGTQRELQRILELMSAANNKIQWTPELSGIQIAFPNDQDPEKEGQATSVNTHSYRGGGAPLTLVHSLEEANFDYEKFRQADSDGLFNILGIAFELLRGHNRIMVERLAEAFFDKEYAARVKEDMNKWRPRSKDQPESTKEEPNEQQ